MLLHANKEICKFLSAYVGVLSACVSVIHQFPAEILQLRRQRALESHRFCGTGMLELQPEGVKERPLQFPYGSLQFRRKVAAAVGAV
jgi:hypothetical protein